MVESSDERLFVLYIPGLDRRRITAEHTPFIHQLLADRPEVTLRTLPTTELLPTMVTGVLPHQHQLWQVSLDPQSRTTALDAALDRLPDFVTTTAQCLRHMTDPAYDLPAIPRWRRRRWVLHRMKYTRRAANGASVLDTIGGFPSLFHLIPDSRYDFVKTFEQGAAMAERLPETDARFAFFEYYAFDLFSHWNLDRMGDVQAKMQVVDEHARAMHDRCEKRGIRFALLVDHGQEEVRSQIDIRQVFDTAGVPRSEFLYFIEVATARLWFFTDRAREQVLARLRDVPGVNVLHRTQMEAYGVRFPDDAFGEYYLVADHGSIFFPHDFYQPLANLYMALTDAGQRSRGGNPIHRGYHGHLPNHPADTGYLVIDGDDLTPRRTQAELIDIAPTVLDLLGMPTPEHMEGRPIFTRVAPVPAA